MLVQEQVVGGLL